MMPAIVPPRHFDGVQYRCPYEAIEPVVHALGSAPGKRILAACGGGDFGFALLEGGARVTLIDNDPLQIPYAKRRARMLLEGNIPGFLARNDHDAQGLAQAGSADGLRGALDCGRGYYVEREGRIDRIRGNLDNLAFLQADILALPVALERIHGLFFSNAIGYSCAGREEDLPSMLGPLCASLSRMPAGGTVYISEGSACRSGRIEREMLRAGFSLDCAKTAVARALQGDLLPHTGVYRKG